MIVSLMWVMETVLSYSICPEYFTKNSNVDYSIADANINQISNQNLILIAAMVASLSFLLATFVNSQIAELQGPLLILGLGPSFVFVSFQLSSIAGAWKIFEVMQSSMQFYGILAFMIGLTLAYLNIVPALAQYIMVAPILGLILHLFNCRYYFFFLEKEAESMEQMKKDEFWKRDD
jgi:hypothetical protein